MRPRARSFRPTRALTRSNDATHDDSPYHIPTATLGFRRICGTLADLFEAKDGLVDERDATCHHADAHLTLSYARGDFRRSVSKLVPGAFPTASRPRAWAAGAPLLLLTTLLGLRPGRKDVEANLPDTIGHVASRREPDHFPIPRVTARV